MNYSTTIMPILNTVNKRYNVFLSQTAHTTLERVLLRNMQNTLRGQDFYKKLRLCAYWYQLIIRELNYLAGGGRYHTRSGAIKTYTMSQIGGNIHFRTFSSNGMRYLAIIDFDFTLPWGYGRITVNENKRLKVTESRLRQIIRNIIRRTLTIQ